MDRALLIWSITLKLNLVHPFGNVSESWTLRYSAKWFESCPLGCTRSLLLKKNRITKELLGNVMNMRASRNNRKSSDIKIKIKEFEVPSTTRNYECFRNKLPCSKLSEVADLPREFSPINIILRIHFSLLGCCCFCTINFRRKHKFLFLADALIVKEEKESFLRYRRREYYWVLRTSPYVRRRWLCHFKAMVRRKPRAFMEVGMETPSLGS